MEKSIFLEMTLSQAGTLKFALEVASREVLDGSDTQKKLDALRAIFENEINKYLMGGVKA